MRLKTLAFALMASLSAAPALAQPAQDAASAAAPGQTSFTYNRSQPTPSAAEKTALQAKGIKVRDMILSTAALADPKGFGLSASVVLRPPVSSQAADPHMIQGSVISRRIVIARSRPDAKGRYPGDGEGPVLIWSINRLEDAFGYRSETDFYTLPTPNQERNGVLTFVRSGRDYTVITPPGLPAYERVNIGDYLTAEAAFYDRKEAPQIAAEMRTALAQLSVAQRAQPYCMTNAGIVTDLLNRCAHRTAKSIVRFNPALAPGVGPATRARLIVFSVPKIGGIGDLQEGNRIRAAAGQLDLRALQALLG